MKALHRLLPLVLLAGYTPAADAQQPTTHLGRAFDRAVVRIQSRADLREHRGEIFDRDSFSVQAFEGLARLDDSTLVGWFSGFSTFVGSTDSTGCHELITGEPTGTRLATMSSTMDSVALEAWVRQWESAVVASYLAPAGPAVSDEDMMVAIFTLIARLPQVKENLARKPSSKPVKMSEAEECGSMKDFFSEALKLEAPIRMNLFRGLAAALNDQKGDSSLFRQ